MTLTKKEHNQKYYNNHKEQHNNNMKIYYKRISSQQRIYCTDCNIDILKCKYVEHIHCKKHLKHIKNSSHEKKF